MKLLALFATAAILAGCASAPSQPSAAVLALRQYVAESKPLMEQGTLKASEYYKGVYSKSMAASAPAYALNGYIDMIEYALQYEAGTLTKERFEYLKRVTQTEVLAKGQETEARTRSAQAQQDIANRANIAATLAASAQAFQLGAAMRAPAAAPAVASGVTMQWPLSSQSTNGTLRYCKYYNGAIVTINIIDLCPLNGP